MGVVRADGHAQSNDPSAVGIPQREAVLRSARINSITVKCSHSGISEFPLHFPFFFWRSFRLVIRFKAKPPTVDRYRVVVYDDDAVRPK